MAAFISGARSTMSLYRCETSASIMRRGFDLCTEDDPTKEGVRIIWNDRAGLCPHGRGGQKTSVGPVDMFYGPSACGDS